MADDLYVAELVVGLGAPADDPGRLPEPDLASDDQGVNGVGAAIAAVIELIGLECVVVVEPVRSGDELWARSNLAAVGGKGVWKQNFSKVAHHVYSTGSETHMSAQRHLGADIPSAGMGVNRN